MKHTIDLKKYELRTDLLLESINDSINKEDYQINEENIDDIKITSIEILKDYIEVLNKKKGTYITIEFTDVTDHDNNNKVKNIVTDELKKILAKQKISKNMSCLVVGLGNDKSTPDALGPLTLEKIIVTNHMYLLNQLGENFRPVSAITPGVMGQTGIETLDIITGIVQKIKPDFVIIVDSLAASSISRVNKTIQITDAGIFPGSGIGNKRSEISSKILGIPVIAIGVPTVVDAVTIVSDTINFFQKQISFQKENTNNKKLKMIPSRLINYEDTPNNLSDQEKKEFLGKIGSLNEEEIKQLMYEVLTPVGYNLMVTPKEIDFIVDKLSDVISNAINEGLHNLKS